MGNHNLIVEQDPGESPCEVGLGQPNVGQEVSHAPVCQPGKEGNQSPQAPIEGLSLGRALLARRENNMYIFPGNATIFEKTFKSGHFWAPQNDVGGRTLGGRQQDLGTLWLSGRLDD